MSQLPTVTLSHLMIRPDEATYHALVASDFLREEFAWVEERTTIANSNRAWSGLYCYGESNYFEFLDPVGTPWSSPEGIAFGVNERGDGELVRSQLEAQLEREVGCWPRTRHYNGREIPWFDYIGVAHGENASLWRWLMAFHEDFLKEWHPELPPQAGSPTHRAVLERYRAYIGQQASSPQRYFKDITEVTLALPPEETVLVAREMTVYGYAVNPERQGFRCEGATDCVKITLATPPEVGIVTFKMALNRNKPGQQQYAFGPYSTLIFHPNQTATWTFRKLLSSG